VILDNYSTHKKNEDWLAKYEGRVQFHFTPTSASWLNQVEIVFSLLTRKALRGASFKSKDQLSEAIAAFIRNHNANAKPFRWRKREVKGSQLRNTIVNLCNSALAAAVLGHVLAHEIGHILLGHNGHADEGLMKATWSAAEQRAMLYRPMRFPADQSE
jgi:DDE superfamily endonuclease